MAVADKVKSIIVEQLGVDEEEVTPDASFVDDLHRPSPAPRVPSGTLRLRHRLPPSSGNPSLRRWSVTNNVLLTTMTREHPPSVASRPLISSLTAH